MAKIVGIEGMSPQQLVIHEDLNNRTNVTQSSSSSAAIVQRPSYDTNGGSRSFVVPTNLSARSASLRESTRHLFLSARARLGNVTGYYWAIIGRPWRDWIV